MLGIILRCALAAFWLLTATACGRATRADTTDITGVMPHLSFSMTRTNDNAPVTAAHYRGKIVLLYFGYTHCPDECPATLANLATMLRRLGRASDSVRVLFVTVDPARDTPALLSAYVRSFGPRVDGLRGDVNAIAALARRYRVLYAVTPGSSGVPYSVTHSDSIFVFDKSGRARIVLMSTSDTVALAAHIRDLGA